MSDMSEPTLLLEGGAPRGNADDLTVTRRTSLPNSRRHLQRRTMSGYDFNPSPDEKEHDDLLAPIRRRRPLYQSTRSAVSQLFIADSSTSPSSRQNSYNDQLPPSSAYAKRPMGENPTMSEHLFSRGLIEGRHSDITVIAFETEYPLHRLILDRAPFFASALTPPWLEASAKTITLHPEDADPNTTQRTFELALRRLYDHREPEEEALEPFSMLSTACWLQMQDLIDDSVTTILRSLTPSSLSNAINHVTASEYGHAGAKILAFAQCILIREGTDSPAAYFEDLPANVLCEVVGNDGFYVQDEYKRWDFARQLLDRRLQKFSAGMSLWAKPSKSKKAPKRLRRFQGRLRDFMGEESDSESEDDLPDEMKCWFDLYAHPEIEPILQLLDRRIYYMHLRFEQLQHIRSMKDIFGLPVVPEKLISEALWHNMELRQKVLNAKNDSLALGLTQSDDDPIQTSFLKLNNSPRTSASDFGPSFSVRTGDSTPSTSNSEFESQKHWIPVKDCSLPLGRYPFDLATKRFSARPRPDKKITRSLHTPALKADDDSQSNSYSMLPPFRFAVQFDKPSSRPLADRPRIYSKTFFYGGSYWNIYIQRLQPSARSRTVPRLGFYLHRTKGQDGDEGYHNFVNERTIALERGMTRPPRANYGATTSFQAYGTDVDHEDTGASHVRAAMQTLMSRPNRISELQDNQTLSLLDDQPSFFDTQRQMTEPSIAAMPPYIDSRPTVRAYFKIHTITPNGRFLNVHQSVPDNFNFSQSWGWKSSAMMAEDDWGAHGSGGSDEEAVGASQKMAKLEVDVGGDLDTDKERDLEGGLGPSSSEGKLRFMVAVGLV